MIPRSDSRSTVGGRDQVLQERRQLRLDAFRDLVNKELEELAQTVIDRYSKSLEDEQENESSHQDELARLRDENANLRRTLRETERSMYSLRTSTGRVTIGAGSLSSFNSEGQSEANFVSGDSSGNKDTPKRNSTVSSIRQSRRLKSTTSKVSLFSESFQAAATAGQRIVMFSDLSPECDDECALLHMIADLNNHDIESTIELIVTDSPIRLRWLGYLFKDKFESQTWTVGDDGHAIEVGCVVVRLYLLYSSSRAKMVEDEFEKKVPQMFEDCSQNSRLRARDLHAVPPGPADVVLLAAPVPDLHPTFFERFTDLQAAYVVGTPGGVNCQQPSWSQILQAMHVQTKVVYLSPQFTRMIRLPKDYVEENPHWNWHMKRTVFDSALTCMARRPEIPAKFGDWGLILRLNAANARLCESWYNDVLGKPIVPVESCPSSIKTRVKAYVERNSGLDRKVGEVAEELRLCGVVTKARLDEHGQPRSEKDKAKLREAYRDHLFKCVYACVFTTETLLFQNQANLTAVAGESNFMTLMPRCGYSEPHDNLSLLYGVDEAIHILKDLPLRSLTPAYDMVGAILALRYMKTEELDFLGLEVKEADHKIAQGLFTDLDEVVSPHPILIVEEQSSQVVDGFTEWLRTDVESDPMLLIDEFWASFRMNSAKGGDGDINNNYYTACDLPRSVWGSTDQMQNMRQMSSMNSNYVAASCLERLIAHPASDKQVGWSILSCLFIMYDCVMVPLQVFEIEEPMPLLLMVSSFWALDVIRGFFVGFYKQGIIEMRPFKVWKNYLKGWFAFDASIVLIDWLLLLWLSTEDKLVGLLRTRRMIRLVRLMQVSKIDRLLSVLNDVFNTNSMEYGVEIMKMIFAILCFTHAIACGFYFISSNSSGSWVTDDRFDDASTWTLYCTAFHWAFAHLLLGEMDIQAKTPLERLYSVVILMVGLIVFSSFVSSITEYMSRIAQLKAEKNRVDLEVRRFMEDHTISARLSAQIFRYRKHMCKQSNREILPRDSILGLQDLPKGLATWLSLEVYMKPLCTHAFFNMLYEDNHDVFALAVHQIMSEIYCKKGRELFQKGQKAETVFIVVFGQATYLRDGHTTQVDKGDWISEHALWLGGWKRRGDLEVDVSMEVCALNISNFRDFCLENVSMGLKALHFAEVVANEKIPYSQLNDVGLDLGSREELIKKVHRRPSQSSSHRSNLSSSQEGEVVLQRTSDFEASSVSLHDDCLIPKSKLGANLGIKDDDGTGRDVDNDNNDDDEEELGIPTMTF